MIVGNVKPLEEIVASIADYKNIFVLGCGGCLPAPPVAPGGLLPSWSRHHKGEPPVVNVLRKQWINRR